MSDLTKFIQDEPIVTITIAAIAVVVLFVFIFPLLFNKVTSSSKKDAREKHRRPLFLGSLFAIVVLVTATILFVPGIRERLAGLLSPEKEEVAKVEFLYIYANVDAVDAKNNTIRVTESTQKTRYEIKVNEFTEVTRGGSKIGLSQINKGEPITITTKKIPDKGNQVIAVEMSLIPAPVITPGGQQFEGANGD